MPDAGSQGTKRWLNRCQAAAYLNQIDCPISVRTLEKMASNNNAGNGPPFMRRGWRTVRYEQSDLDDWAKNNTTRVE